MAMSVPAPMDHGHAPLLGQAANLALLILRKHAGYHLVGTDLSLDGLRSALVISREHDGTQAHGTQFLERCGA